MLSTLRRIRVLMIVEAVLCAGAALVAFVDPAQIFDPLVDGRAPPEMLAVGPMLGAAWLVIGVLLRAVTRMRDESAIRAMLVAFLLGDVLHTVALIAFVDAHGGCGAVAWAHVVVGLVFALNRLQGWIMAEQLAGTARGC